MLTLRHDQATIKKGFITNNSILEESIDKESMISHRYIKDYMIASNLKPLEVLIQ